MFRVLERGGVLTIAEENTPADGNLVSKKLTKIGFDDVNLVPYCADRFEGAYKGQFIYRGIEMYGPNPDSAWLEERTKYWGEGQVIGDEGRVLSHQDWRARTEFEWSYLLIAHRPN